MSSDISPAVKSAKGFLSITPAETAFSHSNFNCSIEETQIKKDYNCDLFLKNEYNFNKKMIVTEIDNDDELVIYKYEYV